MTDFAALKELFGTSLTKTVFFYGRNSSDSSFSLYVANAKAKQQITELLHKQATNNPNLAKIKVKTTKSLSLEKTKSLEEILSRVPHQENLFDPSATIERAHVLVCMAKQAREKFGSILKGCYFNSEKRVLHFHFSPTASQKTIDLAEMRTMMEPILVSNSQRLSTPFGCGISLSLQMPQGTVIAIDNASIVKGKVSGMIKNMLQKLKLPLLVASASSLSVAGAHAADTSMTNNQMTPTAQSTSATTMQKQMHKTHHRKHHKKKTPITTVAAPVEMTTRAPEPEMTVMPEPLGLPAVAYPNGWLAGSLGGLHNSNNSGLLGIGEGGIAFPIGQHFGGQVDGFDGTVAHNNFQNVDGFLFWRNPAQGLVSLHGKYVHSNHDYEELYGLRGDAFINDWTLTLEVGGSHSNIQSGGVYGEALVHWYTKPNWRLDAGFLHVHSNNAFDIGTEYQLGLSSLPGLSVFADAGAGSHDLRYGFLGLRYYFGADKSLERRQREDMVPPSLDLIAFDESQNIMAPRFHS